jgi:hypothetical protein
MKKIILFAGVFIALTSNAQTAKDSLLTKMSKEVCAELEKKDVSNITMDNAQSEIGMLLMPAIMNHSSEIEGVYGSVNDMDAMQKLMMDFGMKLTLKCPKFAEISMKMASGMGGAEPKKGKSPERTVEIKEGDDITATLLSITPGDITTLSIKDAKGKMIKLYWLEYFENADLLKANPKRYLNKKVNITYIEKSVFNAAKKDYKTIKVITAIDLQ